MFNINLSVCKKISSNNSFKNKVIKVFAYKSRINFWCLYSRIFFFF